MPFRFRRNKQRLVHAQRVHFSFCKHVFSYFDCICFFISACSNLPLSNCRRVRYPSHRYGSSVCCLLLDFFSSDKYLQPTAASACIALRCSFVSANSLEQNVMSCSSSSFGGATAGPRRQQLCKYLTFSVQCEARTLNNIIQVSTLTKQYFFQTKRNETTRTRILFSKTNTGAPIF